MIPFIFWMITGFENATESFRKEDRGEGWRLSVILQVILPVAGLALLWGQRGIFAKLLLQLDRSCVSVYCPSLSKREKLLKWASSRLPSTWSSQARTLSSGIPELWKDGSLLCTLINSVVPGACPNPHRHWKKPPLHAQALAYKYLGVIPIFTDEELSNDFTINQERNFINYLQKLQEAIGKWSNRDDLNHNYSSQYVARGMGLYTGEQYRKTVFYIYSNHTVKKRSNVLMYIRGPYATQGKATISPFHSLKTIPVVNVLKDQLEATKTLPFKNDEQKSFLKTISLDFTSLINSVEDKEGQNEIPIQIDMEIDRAKITYIPRNSGVYEIVLISDGELLRGTPYSVQVIKNESGKRDSFSNESENVEEKITFTKRRILSKVIDCIDEKICIENDKISTIRLDSSSSSTESENDLTITAITKKKDEILKTEISCTLENIIEEINNVQEKRCALDDIKHIAENLKKEIPLVDNDSVQVDSQYRIVKDCEEAQSELINLLQPDEIDHVDNIDSAKNKISKLDISLVESTKFLKNMVNASNKQEMLEKLLPKKLDFSEDENNNSKTVPLKRIKSKMCFEISPKSVTSPICSDHIVREVEKSSLNQLNLTEKRRAFSKQQSVSIPDCCDVFNFSSSENEESSRLKGSSELKVLNVFDSLRESRRNSLAESYASLPNYEENQFEVKFKERKEYWEKMSSRSSSCVSLASSDVYQNRKKLVTSTKSNDWITEKYNSANRRNSIKYKSIDSSLEDCTIIPVKERREQLLKNLAQEEKTFNNNSTKKTATVPISNRVKNFDNAIKSPKLNNVETQAEPGKKPKNSIKSQFKRAIKFFKNLEENTKKSKNVSRNRRLSLDFQRINNQKFRLGGSLNLPNISQRFSVSNLYDDVFGNKNGSFRGTPNKEGVANSLASFERTSNANDLSKEEDNSISYNLFVNKSKCRKRKSIKTLFDVNY